MESQKPPLGGNRLQVGTWGNSLAFRIPQHVSDSLGIQANDMVMYQVENGKLVLEACERNEYTLDELLSGEIEPSEEVSWGEPVGAEVW
jgi:antitoxin component of MazEF toxin-antitoxin module